MQLTIIRLVLMLLLLAIAGQASSLTLIPASGSTTGASGATVGWGYIIDNTATDWLVPIGLSINNPAHGMVTDIFDYPVIPPNSTATLNYLFSGSGGPGNSSGLIEYMVPLGSQAGAIESGTVVLQFQLFNANPDADPTAMPVGAMDQMASVAYSVAIAASEVPESGTGTFLLVAALIAAGRWASIICKRVPAERGRSEKCGAR